MWIFDKLFNRKIEGKSSLDDLAENVVVNKETNTTEVGGNLDVDGNFTANSIVENMSGYSFSKSQSTSDFELSYNYASVCKTGNKITFAIFGNLKRLSEVVLQSIGLGIFNIPSIIGEKLSPIQISGVNTLGTITTNFANDIIAKNEHSLSAYKINNMQIGIFLYDFNTFEVGTNYTFRFEMTFLLNDNMAA